jgi:AAT family amino acid transporter
VLFYVGGLLFILMLMPWASIHPQVSPFVIAFHDVGIPNAPHVLNFVVITAVLSAFNSGMYSTGRMLLTLAQNGQAPRMFTAISKRGHVPYVGLLCSASVLLIAVFLNAYYPPEVFLYLASIASFAVIFTWAMILITHWRFRRAKCRDGSAGSLTFRLFAWPLTTYAGLGGLALVVFMMAFHPSTSIALVVAPLWFGALGVGYMVMRRRESIVGRAADAASEGDTDE